jgi:hypothetical protein
MTHPFLIAALACGLFDDPEARVQTQEPVPAVEGDLFWSAIDGALKGGKWWIKLRPRVEMVDQDGFDEDANAWTLRTVLGYESAAWHDTSVLLEFEDVSAFGNERFDSGVNGNTSFPAVVDPEGAEVNQIYFKHTGVEDVVAKVGRQVLAYDNMRHIANNPWRQNEQAMDAFSLLWTGVENLECQYAFLDNVNRVQGDDSPVGNHRMASNLVNVGYKIEGVGRATAYAYLLDYDSFDTLSTNTLGARFAGARPFDSFELQYVLEFANQKDAGNNPNEADQDYELIEVGAKVGAFSARVGNEVLGGSGDVGDKFQTPLAALHAFNGWADKFLTTPDTGLEDRYLGVGAKVRNFDVQVVWHDFTSDSGNLDYGTELDASIAYPLGKKVNVAVKFADYDADDFATDTTKTWAWLTYSP